MSRFVLQTYGNLFYARYRRKCFLNVHNTMIAHHTFNFQHLFHIVFSFIIQRQRLALGVLFIFGLKPSEPQCIRYHKHRTEAHSKCSNHWIQLQCKGDKEHPCRNRNTDNIIDKRPKQILLDVSDNRFAESDGSGYVHQIAFHQNDISRFHGDIGSRTDGNSHIRSCKGGRIVDTVTYHGDLLTFALQTADLLLFILRIHFGYCSRRAHLTTDRFCGLGVVTGKHNDLDTHSR